MGSLIDMIMSLFGSQSTEDSGIGGVFGNGGQVAEQSSGDRTGTKPGGANEPKTDYRDHGKKDAGKPQNTKKASELINQGDFESTFSSLNAFNPDGSAKTDWKAIAKNAKDQYWDGKSFGSKAGAVSGAGSENVDLAAMATGHAAAKRPSQGLASVASPQIPFAQGKKQPRQRLATSLMELIGAR